uniref:AlNc14C296G10297 protein n=2 Tax=Albugo laibachii Nc14 TaxID=890382 RepID=F0WVF7_9STRA|nr:AlNc14C296G10297 [Albugo laibachii Nc14]|eukprot:CCA25398.1 AlNc14C296G10297 [Albugo laibachii Nc14]
MIGGMKRSNIEERLRELEDVLKEISNHEERKNLESIQQSFVETRQCVLQQQLESTRKELEGCTKSKATLCEKIGELEQDRREHTKSVKALKEELEATKEAQNLSLMRVAALERSKATLKQQGCRALTERSEKMMHMIRQLGPEYSCFIQDLDMEQVFFNDGEKRRRAHEDKQETKHQAIQCSMKSSDINTTSPTSVSSSKTAFIDPIGADAASEKAKTVFKSEDCEYERFKQANVSLALEKSTLMQDLDAARKALALMQGKGWKRVMNCVVLDRSLIEKYGSVESQFLREQEVSSKCSKTIAGLEMDLRTAKEALAKHQQSSEKPEEDLKALDTCERIKLLEDNLDQLNSYADHLELVISDCDKCTKKLRNEEETDAK